MTQSFIEQASNPAPCLLGTVLAAVGGAGGDPRLLLKEFTVSWKEISPHG